MQRQPFPKGYLGDWSEEIFEISTRLPTVPVTYELKDLFDESIKGLLYTALFVVFVPGILLSHCTPSQSIISAQYGSKLDCSKIRENEDLGLFVSATFVCNFSIPHKLDITHISYHIYVHVSHLNLHS